MQTSTKLSLIVATLGLGLSVGYCTTFQGGDEHRAELPVQQKVANVTAAARVHPEPLPNPFTADVVRQPLAEPYHPFLADEDDTRSVSVGNVTNGYLVRATRLPVPAANYAVLPRQRARGLLYGTDAMIAMIQHAGAVVKARHDRVLWVGNIGRHGGGDIAWSVSHNSGRDADLAFCYRDSQTGEPADPPDLVPLDGNGVAEPEDSTLVFDTACTWTLIKALIEFEGAQIQYLFISNPLKAKLLAHARKRKEAGALIELADALMGQPGLTLPHNDHIHIRIYCSRRDIEGGCVNSGKIRSGIDTFAGARARRVRTAAAMLRDADYEQRARAAERLALMGARAHLGSIVEAMDDDVPRVRAAAARAVGRLGSPRDVARLSERFEAEDDPATQVALLEAATELGGADAGAFLARVLLLDETPPVGPLPETIVATYRPPESEDPIDRMQLAVVEPRYQGVALPLDGRRLTVKLAAIEQAAISERPEPVASLVELLGSDDPLIRGRSARALRLLTAHSFGVRWSDPELAQADRTRGLEAWKSWLDDNGKKGRDAWLAAGLSLRGYTVPRIHKRHIWEIVRAVTDETFISYNAQRLLIRLSRHAPRSLEWSQHDAAWHWTRWFERRRGRFGLPQCPPELSTFNK